MKPTGDAVNTVDVGMGSGLTYIDKAQAWYCCNPFGVGSSKRRSMKLWEMRDRIHVTASRLPTKEGHAERSPNARPTV